MSQSAGHLDDLLPPLESDRQRSDKETARALSRIRERAEQYRASLTPHEYAMHVSDDALAECIAAGRFTIADTYDVREPVPLNELQTPSTASYCVVEISVAGRKLAEIPPEALGLFNWRWQYKREALAAVQCNVIKLGYPAESVLSLHIKANEDYARRQEAAELLPDIDKQFPAIVRSFEQLKVVEWNSDAISSACKWVDSARMIVANRLGQGLSIRHRQTGCGKSSLICAAALEASKRHALHAHFLFVPELIAADFADQNAIIKAATRTDILVLDDIDASVKPAQPPNDGDSSRSRQTLLRIVNARYNDGLPTLWTSNTATTDELQYNLGDRILRRLAERNTPLQFGAKAWDWGLHTSK